MKRFIDLADFNREQVLDLLRLAQALQDRPQPQALVGKVLGLVFFNRWACAPSPTARAWRMISMKRCSA
jgi:ornithine carbamoyltransferase